MKVEEREFRALDPLVSYLSSLPSEWVFRGQRDAKWALQPSIERLFDGLPWDSPRASRLEELSLQRFKQFAHHHLLSDDRPTTKLGWLSLMQHHGAPTRLLDFSESPFVALFFAFDGAPLESNGHSAIWALNYRLARDTTLNHLMSTTSLIDSDRIAERCALGYDPDGVFEEVIEKSPRQVIWVGEPERTNRRLSNQKGTFLLASNFSQTLQDALSNSEYSSYGERLLIKITVAHSMASEVFKFLQRATICCATMYGGLDGFAKDIAQELIHANHKPAASL